MMITLTELETILIACLPSLTAIVSIVTAVSTIIKSLNKLKDNEALKQERDALLEQNKKFGDMIITIEIQIPKCLSEKEIELYKQLGEISGSNIREV